MEKTQAENNETGQKKRGRPPGIRLNKLGDISRFLGRIANEMYRSEIDHTTGSKLAYVLNIMRGTLEAGQLEKEIIMYVFHHDPGHGWLAVKRTELVKLGIFDAIISHFRVVF
jgi:hypothetical protein